MRTWIETSGKNEEAAIAAALSQLGLDRDDVSVEVLERAKSGFLGLGSAPARVRVHYEGPEAEKTPPAAPKAAKAPAPAAAVAPVVQAEAEAETATPVKKQEADKATQRAAAPEDPAAETEDVAGEIVSFLSGLMTHMHYQAVPRVSMRKEGGYQVMLEGERIGGLIGHRGETLDAIQQLTNFAINRDRVKRVRVFVDAENYRKKREEALQHLAKKVAGKVLKTHYNITLEPMNAYERHVIHETLQDVTDIVTYSTGTEPHRRTVVAYNKGKHTY